MAIISILNDNHWFSLSVLYIIINTTIFSTLIFELINETKNTLVEKHTFQYDENYLFFFIKTIILLLECGYKFNEYLI